MAVHPCGLFPLHQSFLPAPLLQQENSLVVCFLFISHSCQLHCCSKKTPLWFVSSSSVIPASSIAAARKLPCGLFPLHQSFLPAPLLQQENSLVVCFLFISHSCQLHCCSKKTPLWFVSSSSVIPASSIAAARKLPCGLFPLHQSFLPAPLLQQENSLVVCFLFISHSCQLHCCSKKTPSHVPCHTPSVVGSNISAEPNNTPMGLCMSVYCLFNRLIHGIARSGNIRPGHTESSIPKESVSPWMSVFNVQERNEVDAQVLGIVHVVHGKQQWAHLLQAGKM